MTYLSLIAFLILLRLKLFIELVSNILKYKGVSIPKAELLYIRLQCCTISSSLTLLEMNKSVYSEGN